MRRIAAVLAGVLLLVMCCPAALAAETDSDTSITVAAMATTTIDYRDLLEPETCLLKPENNILHDNPEASISREVISTTQAPFYVERFWNAQPQSDAI